MPIRPDQKPLYPVDWADISRRIRYGRAGGCCECTGQCGTEHATWRCDAPDGVYIVRHRDHPERWRSAETINDELASVVGTGGDPDEELRPYHPLRPYLGKPITVVLTVAHLDHDPTNNDPTNLLACCQRCHLLLDHEQHCHSAALTRDSRSGQQRLFEEVPRGR